MSCKVLIYITIYFIFPKPITTSKVPTTKSQTGVSANKDPIDQISINHLSLPFVEEFCEALLSNHYQEMFFY
jgi:hypothetical protein